MPSFSTSVLALAVSSSNAVVVVASEKVEDDAAVVELTPTHRVNLSYEKRSGVDQGGVPSLSTKRIQPVDEENIADVGLLEKKALPQLRGAKQLRGCITHGCAGNTPNCCYLGDHAGQCKLYPLSSCTSDNQCCYGCDMSDVDEDGNGTCADPWPLLRMKVM